MVANELEKLPTNQGVNRPDDGAYGERKALADLKGSLPSSAPGPGGPTPPSEGPPGQVRPTPIDRGAGPGAMGPGGAGSTGVPDVLMGPTAYPNRPVSTPYQPGGANPMAAGLSAGNVQQSRLQVLDSLINSPSVGEETKEWAEIVRASLIFGGSGG